MFERRRAALVAGTSLLAVVAALTFVVAVRPAEPVLQGIDDAWLATMTDLRTPWLTNVAKVVSTLGGPVVMVPLRLVVVAALALQRRWLQLGAFVGAVVTSELCIGPLKALIDRPRPPFALVDTESASFPSGHAIAASVTAIGVVVVLVPRRRRVGWTIAAASFATAMAMSRCYLGAHWLSDVVAGACIGTGVAVVWPAALEVGRARRQAVPAVARDRARHRLAGALRIVSIVLLATALTGVVAMHVLRPDLSPVGDRISEYAIGPYGYVMTTAFVTIGAGLFALVWPLMVVGGRWSRAVPLAIGAAGVGMVVSAIYRTDPVRSGSTADTIHSQASALATMALIAAALAWSVLRRPRWRPGVALALTAAAFGAVSPLVHRSAWTGASQRMLWLVLLVWLVVTAWATHRQARWWDGALHHPDSAPIARACR